MGVVVGVMVGGGCRRHDMHAHVLDATYIWYSSIASTNWPHESKSVPFLKLACHFWTVLWTSDMMLGPGGGGGSQGCIAEGGGGRKGDGGLQAEICGPGGAR